MARGDETVIFGDGEQMRDFVYVGDIVDACSPRSDSSGGPYNIGTGEATSVTELHAACRRVAGGAAEPALRSGRGSATCCRSVLDAGACRARARLAGRRRAWTTGSRRTWAWTKEAAGS